MYLSLIRETKKSPNFEMSSTELNELSEIGDVLAAFPMPPTHTPQSDSEVASPRRFVLRRNKQGSKEHRVFCLRGESKGERSEATAAPANV